MRSVHEDKSKGNKTARIRIYNSTNTCHRCGTNLINAKGSSCRERDSTGNCTGEWLCHNCYQKDYQRNDPNSTNNIIKKLADHRTGNLRADCSSGKGYIFEQLTCISRGVKNINIENDNFHSPIDHTRDTEYGILQTKGAIYQVAGFWNFGLNNENKKEFDNMIFYCMDRKMENVERVYIIPKKEIIKRKASISIVKNPTRNGWYEIYRVEERPYNNTYHKMSI